MYAQKNVLFLLLFFLFVHLNPLQAQRRSSPKYDISAGIGLFPTFLKDEGRMIVPPLSLTADYRVAPNFSVGLFLGYSSTESNQAQIDDEEAVLFRNRFSSVGLRLAAHTTGFENWDIYGGLTFGYMHSNIDAEQAMLEKMALQKGIRPSSGKLVMTGFLGSRVKVSRRVGIFAELGFGVSLVQTGISYRF